MIDCSKTDFMFPMQADIYYPIASTGLYGNVEKQWVYSQTVACNLTPAGSALKEEVKPNVNITQDKLLVGRTKGDVRMSDNHGNMSITNVLITNIRDKNGNEVHLETTGQRSNRSTIFEVASQDPYLNPFGSVEFYQLVLRRAENQAADV